MNNFTSEFVAPEISWLAMMPVIIVIGAGVLGVLVEALAPVRLRRPGGIALGVLATLGSFVSVAYLWNSMEDRRIPIFNDEFTMDLHGLLSQGILAIIGFLAVLVVADRTAVGDGSFAAQPSDRPGSHEEALSIEKGYQRTEIFPLMLLSLGGMMVFPVANSFVALFVALEVMSLPLYILAATARHQRRLSQEAALKYFILGAFASGFFLMGSAFIYGATGTLSLTEANQILRETSIEGISGEAQGILTFLAVGTLMVMVGLLFKVGAAPFHAWTPDVYTGAPTPITGFMAAAVKVAAFAAMSRFLRVLGLMTLGAAVWVYAVIIMLTILVGTFAGVIQTNIKRLLAYSSIAHAGYILLGLFGAVLIPAVRPDVLEASAASILPTSYDLYFYLLAYGIGTVGIFALIPLVRGVDKEGNVTGEVTDFRRWAGLGRKHPFFGGAVVLFMLSFAGIPLTSGFIGKFLMFKDAFYGGFWWLVIIALISSAITAFFYFRVVRVLFFEEPTGDTVVVEAEGYSTATVIFAVAGTVLLGVFPSLFTAVIPALPQTPLM